MFFDILPVFVLLFFSCLFLSTTTVHGLPSSSSAAAAADLSSKLRFVNPRPVLRVDQPSNGDMPDMFIGENHEDDDDSSYSSLNLPNEPSSNSNWLLQKFFEQDKQERKRSSLHSAVHSRTDAFKGDSTSNFNQIDEPIRLSPSLKTLIETNPFARAWLTMLLQKLMQEQHVPYIFKYGRRRK